MRALFLFLAIGCGTASPPPVVDDASTPPVMDAATVDAPAVVQEAGMDSIAPPDPCPNLSIPQTLYGRNVVYREFGPNAKGDGTYFASQAPYRLGFNRTKDTIWIVKFRTEANTFMGKISAYGDATAGVAWITNDPMNAQFAIDHKLLAYGNHGGGTIFLTIARDAKDAMTLASDPKYSWMGRLEGDHCYYAMFENTVSPSQMLDANFIATAKDDCGDNTMSGVCYYLAFDMQHMLHDIVTMQLYQGNVIPGLTQ